jgi:GNAT superfamily N-acetyltransferase
MVRHFAHGEAPNHALLGRLAGADGHDRVVLLGVGAGGTVIGHAEYVAEAGAAEFALMVAPPWRDCGVGKALLAVLLATAADAGQRKMHGLIQASLAPVGTAASRRLARSRGRRNNRYLRTLSP